MFAIKIADANRNQLGSATYDIMLFKGDIHQDHVQYSHSEVRTFY
jgi:hypothetical protein